MKSMREHVGTMRMLLGDPVALEMMRVGPRLEETLRAVTEAAEAELDALVTELTPEQRSTFGVCKACEARHGMGCYAAAKFGHLLHAGGPGFVGAHAPRLAAAPTHVKLVPYVLCCRWCTQPMVERRVCEQAPPDYDEACELVPNFCQPEEG